jgi:hypothetical protein
MHEATALSGYLKKFEETHRAIEVIKEHKWEVQRLLGLRTFPKSEFMLKEQSRESKHSTY